MSILVAGTKTKNVVFNRKNVLLVKNKTPVNIFAKPGILWTQSNIMSENFDGGARYANGLWVACSYGMGLYYSEDGKTWTQSNITTGSFIGGARYANGLWVACGSNSNGLYYSADGKTWTQSNVTTGSFIGGARYANGLWVACSGNNAYKGLYCSEGIF